MLTAPKTPPRLILASSSRYRAELLSRLHVPFAGIAPDIDETPQPGEAAEALTRRLALSKAERLVTQHPDCWILGSDQAAECNGRILGKPGNHERAVEQLQTLSGQRVRFLTAVAFVNGATRHEALDITTVQVRQLTLAEIERYLMLEPAYDCAGSFKCEGLGISLFEHIESTDPTGLIGLPLMTVAAFLRQAGFQVP